LGVEIDGLGEVQRELEDLQDDYSDTPTRFVGSNQDYAPHLEYGTSPHVITPNDPDGVLAFDSSVAAFGEERTVFTKRVQHPGTDPNPHWRPAKASASRDPVGYIRETLGVGEEAIDSSEALVRLLATAMERDVKERITRLGLVDTGAYRASVGVSRAPSGLPDVDED